MPRIVPRNIDLSKFQYKENDITNNNKPNKKHTNNPSTKTNVQKEPTK